MDTYTAGFLSAAPNGDAIPITATATGSAQTIHTAPTGTTAFDEISVWAANTTGSAIQLTIEWNGASNALVFSVPANSVAAVIPEPGIPLRNAGTVKAFASAGTGLFLFGKTVRIVPGG